jgi:hypothetical protein
MNSVGDVAGWWSSKKVCHYIGRYYKETESKMLLDKRFQLQKKRPELDISVEFSVQNMSS